MNATTNEPELLQFWESEKTKPKVESVSGEATRALKHAYDRDFAAILQKPFCSRDQIRASQFERIQHLVKMAFTSIPVYRRKYDAVGFEPGDLRTWEDFEQLPPITKEELIAAFPHDCLNPRWAIEDLFSTRSSGSSGRTLLIKVDLNAIVVDTLQGFRAFWLQTGLKYSASHLAAHIYTVPWWFDSVGRDFNNAFISSLNPAERTSDILREIRPRVISCYPTNLRALVPRWKEFAHEGLYGVIVHSEASTALERQRWSDEIGVPVVDEYSSEEGTRMALELPCGHYHVHEDAVYLEALEPGTLRPQERGMPGVVAVTNLLNEAMPFIRYLQGDFVTRPVVEEPCLCGWSQLASINGRVNDAFHNAAGEEVPAGTLLDVTYRWMYDIGVNIQEFELVQTAPDRIRATFQVGNGVPSDKISVSSEHLADLLEVCLGCRVQLETIITKEFPKRAGKRRPIRREFTTSDDIYRDAVEASSRVLTVTS
ncbi:MAG: phenylacetate--CoA ligase family protein [Chthoniobacterales bacterium]